MVNTVLCGSFTLACCVLVYGAGPCPSGTYRDHGTGNCDPCSDICEHRRQQGTETECRKNCPDYDLKDQDHSDPVVSPPPTLSIVIPVVAAGVIVAVVVVVLLVRRKPHPTPVRRTSNTPAPVPETVPLSPGIECTEQSIPSSATSSTVEMNDLDEQAMMAHPDLPENNIYNMTRSIP